MECERYERLLKNAGASKVDVIEVGHVFQLGSKYSEAMNATFLDESGKPTGGTHDA